MRGGRQTFLKLFPCLPAVHDRASGFTGNDRISRAIGKQFRPVSCLFSRKRIRCNYRNDLPVYDLHVRYAFIESDEMSASLISTGFLYRFKRGKFSMIFKIFFFIDGRRRHDRGNHANDVADLIKRRQIRFPAQTYPYFRTVAAA